MVAETKFLNKNPVESTRRKPFGGNDKVGRKRHRGSVQPKGRACAANPYRMDLQLFVGVKQHELAFVEAKMWWKHDFHSTHMQTHGTVPTAVVSQHTRQGY